MRHLKTLFPAVMAATLLLAGCGSPVATSNQPKAVTLMLDWYPNADHAGIYAAVDEGYYKAAGLAPKIVVPSDPSAALKLVATGKADFAVSYEPDFLLARDQGIPDTAVMALVQVPLNSIISLKSEGITRPKDLVGKSVGMAGLPSDTALLSTVLQDDGASLSQITQTNVGYNLVPALLSGKVNAIIGGYWSWEALQIALQGKPVNVLRLNDWGVPTYNELIIVTSDQMLKNHPEIVRAFVQATEKGLAYAIHHPQTAAQDVAKAGQDLDPKLVSQSVALLAPIFQGSAPEPGYMDPKQWDAYAQWLYQKGLIPKAEKGSATMTDAFLTKNP